MIRKLFGESNEIELKVQLEKETVWLTQSQMAKLFNSSRTNVVEHIANIYTENELVKNSTYRKFRQVQKEGNRTISRDIDHYNLNMIISVGYRIKSARATQFRIWATNVLRKYIVEDYAINQQKLKQNYKKFETLLFHKLFFILIIA